MELLDLLELLEHRDLTEQLEKMVKMELPEQMELQEAMGHLDPPALQATKELQVWLGLLVLLAQMDPPVQSAPLVQQDLLA